MPVTNVRVHSMDVTLNGVDLGHIKGGVEITYEPQYHDVMVDKYGETIVEKYLTGEKVTAKMALAEATIANIGVAIPQGSFAGAANARRTVGSKAGKKASTSAYQLVLHPSNLGTKQFDFVMHKAYVESAVTLPHQNDTEVLIEVTFVALLDESKSDGNYLGFFGDSAA